MTAVPADSAFLRERGDDRRDVILQARNLPPKVQPQIERHLLVAGAAGMQPLAQIADALDELPLDECMHVFIGTVDERGLAPAPFENVVQRGRDLLRFRASNTPAPASPSTHARLPATSSSKRRLSNRNDDPNSNATGSGSPLKRPDQRLAIGYFAPAPRTIGALRGAAPRVVRCRFHRKSPDLDEAFGGRVIERVALVVRRKAVIVERERRLPAHDAAIALEELQTDVPVTRCWMFCTNASIADRVGENHRPL